MTDKPRFTMHPMPIPAWRAMHDIIRQWLDQQPVCTEPDSDAATVNYHLTCQCEKLADELRGRE